MSDASGQSEAVLEGLFSSRVRLKVLLRLVAPPFARYHSRELAKQTGEHFNAVWQELKHLQALGVLRSQKVGNQVQYEADPAMPLLPELRDLLARSVGARDAAPQASPSVPATTPAAPMAPTSEAASAGLVMGETD